MHGLVETLTSVIAHFDNKELAFGIAAGILLIALGVGLCLQFKHRQWLGPIRRLTRVLRQSANSGALAKRLIDEAEAAFGQAPTLNPLWRDYREHLVSNPQDPNGGWLNLIDPRAWFSADALPGRGYEHWCATWAGVFLTVGLLVTFIGLSAALLKVGDINGADSVAMKAAITGILGVSSAKFITSIAGLIAYIGFSLLTRHYQSLQHAAAARLATEVQRLSLPLTPELLLYRQQETADKQLLRLERLTDDLAVAIDQKIQVRLADLSNALTTDLGKVRDALPAATAEPIVKAIDGVSERIAKSSTEGMDGLLVRVAELADKLVNIKDGMGGIGADFGKQIAAAAGELKGAAEAIKGGMNEGASDLKVQIDASSQQLDAISDKLGTVPAQIGTALDQTLKTLTSAVENLTAGLGQGGADGGAALKQGGQEAGQQIKAAVDEAGSAFDQAVSQVSEKLAAAAGELKGSAEAIKGGMNEGASDLKAQIEASSKQLDAISDKLGTVPAQIGTALDEMLKTLTSTVENLTAGLGQGGADGGAALKQGGQDAGEQIKTAVDEAGSAFDRAVSQVSKKLVADLTAVLTRLDSAIVDLAQRLQTIESSLKTLPDAVAAQVNHLKAAGQTFEDAGQVVTDASTALQGASAPLTQTAKGMTTALDMLKQQVAQATALHQETSQAVQAALAGLQQAAAAAEKTFETHEQRFGQADEALARALDNLRTGVEEVASATQTVFGEYEQHIKSAVSNLALWAEGMEDAAGDLAKAINALTQRLK